MGQDIPEQAHLRRIVHLVDKDQEAKGIFRHSVLNPVVRTGAVPVVIHDVIRLCFLGIEMHRYFPVWDAVDPLVKSTLEAMIARQAQNTTVTSSVLGAGRYNRFLLTRTGQHGIHLPRKESAQSQPATGQLKIRLS